MGTYRISQLAERSGVPASTLRFYETAGLLPAERTPSGYRVYDDEAVRRLAFISSAKLLGLALEEIGDLLTGWERGVCAAVRERMLPLVATRIADADQRAAELAAFSARLAAVSHRAGRTGAGGWLRSGLRLPDHRHRHPAEGGPGAAHAHLRATRPHPR